MPPFGERSLGLESVAFGTHLILFRSGGRRLFLLNESAAFLWEAWLTADSPAEVVELVAVGLGLSRRRSREYLERALADWRKGGLLGPAPPDEAAGELEFCAPPSTPFERCYRLWNRSFRLQFSTQSQLERFHSRLAHLECDEWTQTPCLGITQAGTSYRVSNGNVAEVLDSWAESVGLLLRRIVERLCPNLNWDAQFHAALLKAGDAAVVLPAGKGRGKTTLASYLGRRGLDCLSDEMAMINSSAQALGLPLQLAIKEGSWVVLEKDYPELRSAAITSLGGDLIKLLPPASAAYGLSPQLCTVKALVFPRYHPSAKTQFSELAPADALARLIEADSWFHLSPAAAGRWASWLQQTSAFALTYSSLSEAGDAIRGIIR